MSLDDPLIFDKKDFDKFKDLVFWSFPPDENDTKLRGIFTTLEEKTKPATDYIHRDKLPTDEDIKIICGALLNSMGLIHSTTGKDTRDIIKQIKSLKEVK